MATKQAKYATAAMKVKRAMPAKFMEIQQAIKANKVKSAKPTQPAKLAYTKKYSGENKESEPN